MGFYPQLHPQIYIHTWGTPAPRPLFRILKHGPVPIRSGVITPATDYTIDGEVIFFEILIFFWGPKLHLILSDDAWGSITHLITGTGPCIVVSSGPERITTSVQKMCTRRRAGCQRAQGRCGSCDWLDFLLHPCIYPGQITSTASNSSII